MEKIRISIKRYMREDMGLTKGHTIGANLRALIHYTSKKIVLNTREHSINQTAEKLTIVHYSLVTLIA